jgi:hypothetical protein
VTGRRRSGLLIAVVIAVLVGVDPTGARAAFSDRTELTASIRTLTVDAPAQPTATGTTCSTSTWYYNVNGQVTQGTTTTLRTTVRWDSSTTPGVTSYVITAYGNGRATPVAEVSASFRRATISVDAAAYPDLTVTVTTRTAYGWTAQSPTSGAITC